MDDVPSIAVLPFRNMSADPEQEYFCEGMAEEIINALTGLEGLHVASRTSAFKARDYDISEIGVRLKVGAVLEGSVRKAGNRLRVTAQLINVGDGYHLWSDRYDRDMDDVFAVQDEIAQAVVEKLKVKLLGEQNALVIKRPTDNLAAYNLYLQARYYGARATGAGYEKALACLTQALALEPTYVQAQAGIARVQATRAVISLAAPHTVMPEAKDAALKTLALDETVADAYEALAFVLQYYEWDWAGAERAYRRALELSPGDSQTRFAFASMLAMIGRVDESVAQARSAVEHDPLSAMPRSQLAQSFVIARRFEEAIAESHAAIELDPRVSMSYTTLGWALVGLGRLEETVEAFRQ